MTSSEDVEKIVAYLKLKPLGASMADCKGALESSLLDGRKVSAYEYWGFIEKSGNTLRLTQQGREFANGGARERTEVYRNLLRRSRAYKLPLERAFHNSIDCLLSSDVGSWWFDNVKEEIGKP